MPATTELQHLLCEQWCADADMATDEGGIRISMPLTAADGDAITVWLTPDLGGWVVRDHGTTLMRLSYGTDLDLLAEGHRAKVVARILSEQGVQLDDGELSTRALEGSLGVAMMRMGQAMLRLADIRLWSKTRIAGTFYEDLERTLRRVAGNDRVHSRYTVPGIPDAGSYPVDFAVLGGTHPLYVFGVPSTDKARLVTIMLQHLQHAQQRFDSMVVCSDLDALPRADRRRLINAANDIVTGADEIETIERKVRARL